MVAVTKQKEIKMVDMSIPSKEAFDILCKEAYDIAEASGDHGACGFAWIKYAGDARTKEARTLKNVFGFERDWCGGLRLWNPSRWPGQSIAAKERATVYIVSHMTNVWGFDVYGASRLD